jgi:hypothetical protein
MSTRDSQQCQGKKKDGLPCRNRTTADGLCWIHSQVEESVRVKNSKIRGAGKGLFASIWDYTSKGRTKPEYKGAVVFQEGDHICSYDGEILSDDELEERYPRDTIGQYVYTTQDGGVNIDAHATTSCFGRYANSCRSTTGKLIRPPNADIVDDPHDENRGISRQKETYTRERNSL